MLSGLNSSRKATELEILLSQFQAAVIEEFQSGRPHLTNIICTVTAIAAKDGRPGRQEPHQDKSANECTNLLIALEVYYWLLKCFKFVFLLLLKF